jgi:NAD(P)-dependent dehydrogenase (short-subunit alcohol dehydrogenase family)
MRQSRQKTTPKQVEDAFKQLCRGREIRKNLAAMRRSGAKVRYHQVDVRDEQAFGDLIEEIYRDYGRLDGFIHGAGVIEDKLIEDKTPESFNRVFDTKADSAFIASRKLRPESLRFLVFFSSIVGRFGNRGQSDYAAANEVLNKLGVYLDHQWPGRVVSINWNPWANAGMASTEVQRQFVERGIQAISASAGRRALDEEVSRGRKGQVEVLVGDGPWSNIEAEGPSCGRVVLPFLDGVPFKSDSGHGVEVILTLDPTRDRYLQHHQLDGKPVFPFAAAMELMSEVVQRGWDEWVVTGIRSVRRFRGITMGDGPCEIRVVATPQAGVSAEGGGLEVDVEISELDRTDPPCYRGTVEIGKAFPSPLSYDPSVLSELRPFPMTMDEAYRRWLFHGPSLQGISSIEGINEKGICAVLLPSSPGECLHEKADGRWLIDPVVVDSAFQLSILWERAHYDMTPLISSVKYYRRFGSPSDLPIRCWAQTQPSAGGHILLTDFYFLDSEERVISVIEKMEASCSKELNRLTGS